MQTTRSQQTACSTDLLSVQSAKHAMSNSLSTNARCLDPVFTPWQSKHGKMVIDLTQTKSENKTLWRYQQPETAEADIQKKTERKIIIHDILP